MAKTPKVKLRVLKDAKNALATYTSHGVIKKAKYGLIAAGAILAGKAAYNYFKSGKKGKWITVKGGRRIFIKG